uniref:CarD-like/TRCF domain protein n=1 Tax=Agathobacter sp. TaxID=2021311 RepID=UPI004056D5DE
MFQKKQKIYSETLGVCIVDNIVQLPAGKGEKVSYYVLKSLFEPSKVAYIPVENHQVVLRELFLAEEAKELQKDPKLKENEKLLAAVNYVLQGEKESYVTVNQ